MREKKSLEIRDKNGAPLSEGDYVMGHRGWMSGDGYLPKDFPEKIREISKIEWNKNTGSFELKPICIHPGDCRFRERRWYRSICYSLEVSNKTDARGCVAGYRDDMMCERIEKITSFNSYCVDCLRDATVAIDHDGHVHLCDACASKKKWKWVPGLNAYHIRRELPRFDPRFDKEKKR